MESIQKETKLHLYGALHQIGYKICNKYQYESMG
jgi:hypothetical protein